MHILGLSHTEVQKDLPPELLLAMATGMLVGHESKNLATATLYLS